MSKITGKLHAVGEPLAAAWLTEIEDESGEEFIETFLQHDSLATEQRHQALSTVARAAQDQPGLAAGAHRAVAANPERLLPLAAQTVTTELSIDYARQWLTGLEHAVADRATDPDSDPETYEWASSLISEAQERTAADRDDLEDLGVPLTPEVVDDPEQPDAETGADAPSVDSPFVLVKPRVGRLTRTAITFLALCHLILVAAVPSGVALTSNIGDDGWSLWFFVAINVFMHLTVASAFGGRQLSTIPLSWGLAPGGWTPVRVVMRQVSG